MCSTSVTGRGLHEENRFEHALCASRTEDPGPDTSNVPTLVRTPLSNVFRYCRNKYNEKNENKAIVNP